MFRRHLKFLLATVTILALVAVNFNLAGAATITVASDTMTSIKENTTADHTVVFTLPATIDFDRAGQTDVLRVDYPHSSAFTQSGTWITADFTFNDGSARTINAVAQGAGTIDCTVAAGVNNVCVAIDTTNHIFTIKPSADYTASAAAAVVTFTIDGTATDGTLTNPTSANGYVTIFAMCDETASCVTSFTSSHTVSVAIRIVTAVNTEVSVTATVDPTLTFSLGAATVALGTLSTSSTSSGSHTALIATNGASGFTLTYNGATLTSGGNTISAIGGTPATSSTGGEQFGVNLKDNATPNVGAEVTQTAGTCSIAADYNTADNFAFEAGSTISMASAAAPADCTYTVSYIANIATTTEAGSYATTVTYVGTGLF